MIGASPIEIYDVGFDMDIMLSFGRCDEWYHTQCVNMPDLEVDLVDQFICPPCIESPYPFDSYSIWLLKVTLIYRKSPSLLTNDI